MGCPVCLLLRCLTKNLKSWSSGFSRPSKWASSSRPQSPSMNITTQVASPATFYRRTRTRRPEASWGNRRRWCHVGLLEHACSFCWIQITAAVEPTLQKRTWRIWLRSARTTCAAARRVRRAPERNTAFTHTCADSVDNFLFSVCSSCPGDCCVSKSEGENFPSKKRETFACTILHHGVNAHAQSEHLDQSDWTGCGQQQI